MNETAPLSPATVTVNGYHWRRPKLWPGLHFEDATLRTGSIWGSHDYHLRVPWMHPDDYERNHADPDSWAYYRVRLKPGWRSFVRVDGVWMVSRAERKELE